MVKKYFIIVTGKELEVEEKFKFIGNKVLPKNVSGLVYRLIPTVKKLSGLEMEENWGKYP